MGILSRAENQGSEGRGEDRGETPGYGAEACQPGSETKAPSKAVLSHHGIHSLSLSLSLFLFASDTGARKVAHWIRVLSLQA